MSRILSKLNPIEHLGERNYSFLPSLLTTILICVASEIYAFGIVKNPEVVGVYIIFINVALIMYFAFRNGLRAGFISSCIAVLYYFYIIYSRHYVGKQLNSGIETTIILGLLYFFLAGTIGWLKQRIDTLIEREADQRRRLEAIIQQLPVGVLITDSNGILTQRNKKIDTILGIKIPIGFQIGKDALPAKINGKEMNPAQSPLYHSLTTGKLVVQRELTYTRQDGKELSLQVSSSPIHNRNNKIIAAASIISDITPQKEMEKRKDDFVNMASHELKTPITSMKLYIDSLMGKIRKYDDEKALRTLENIKNQTERLQKLVNDLLDVSRLQTGKLGFSKEEFRIDSLIEETIELLQGSAKNQEIIFSKRSAITLRADKFRVYQVLTNLITNAIKYSPDGKEIIVKLYKSEGKAVISIKDQGIGIEKSQQKKVFERLYQVTDDKEKTFPGFGMGLYISKEIVRRHKGAIWVESEKGKGSTFYFSLPLPTK